jgi:hypothetical protein
MVSVPAGSRYAQRRHLTTGGADFVIRGLGFISLPVAYPIVCALLPANDGMPDGPVLHHSVHLPGQC